MRDPNAKQNNRETIAAIEQVTPLAQVVEGLAGRGPWYGGLKRGEAAGRFVPYATPPLPSTLK